MNKNAHRNAEDSRSRRAMVGGKLSFSASEAYKLLRTNVMFSLAEDEDGSRIFGITSPIKGEGKSTTAINLDYSIAESAKRVLFIEMDMRLPVLHKSLPISKAPGLSDLLVGSALLTDALQKSGIHDDLFVITAGNLPPNPSELLGSERMKALLESFRERFDYILCDLPPITVVSDALMISPMLSGMIVVVRKNYTDMRALDVTMRQLEFTQVKVLGFVMTLTIRARPVRSAIAMAVNTVTNTRIATTTATMPQRKSAAARRTGGKIRPRLLLRGKIRNKNHDRPAYAYPPERRRRKLEPG